jgi:hypothetical protein
MIEQFGHVGWLEVHRHVDIRQPVVVRVGELRTVAAEMRWARDAGRLSEVSAQARCGAFTADIVNEMVSLSSSGRARIVRHCAGSPGIDAHVVRYRRETVTLAVPLP